MANKYSIGTKGSKIRPSIFNKVDEHEHYFCVTCEGRIEKRPVSDQVPARARVTFKSKYHLARKFSKEQLDALLSTTFHVKVKPSVDVYEAAQRVWVGLDICKDTDFTLVKHDGTYRKDKLGYMRYRPYRFHRPGRVYSPKARPGESEKMDFFRRKLSPYAKLILQIIEGFNKEFVTEEELLDEMYRREDDFNSKQPLYRLLRYYRGPLRDKGFIMFGN